MGRIFLLPVWVIRGIVGLIAGIVKGVFSLGRGTLRFSFRNLPGLIVGAAVALVTAKFIADRKKA